MMECERYTYKKKFLGYVCNHISPPTETHECMEVINTVGRACKKCTVTRCYRQGWNKSMVDGDNKRLVAGGKPLTKQEQK